MIPATIGTILDDILTAATAALNQAGANGAPARRFVAHGPALWEGEQLTVWSPGVRTTKPFPLTRLSAVKDSVIPAVDVMVEVVRDCWPTAHMSAANKALPEPALFTAAALALANDASALFAYLSGLAVAGDLLPSLSTIGRADDVALSPLVALPPQGTLAGWRWPIAIKVAIP